MMSQMKMQAALFALTLAVCVPGAEAAYYYRSSPAPIIAIPIFIIFVIIFCISSNCCGACAARKPAHAEPPLPYHHAQYGAMPMAAPPVMVQQPMMCHAPMQPQMAPAMMPAGMPQQPMMPAPAVPAPQMVVTAPQM